MTDKLHTTLDRLRQRYGGGGIPAGNSHGGKGSRDKSVNMAYFQTLEFEARMGRGKYVTCRKPLP